MAVIMTLTWLTGSGFTTAHRLGCKLLRNISLTYHIMHKHIMAMHAAHIMILCLKCVKKNKLKVLLVTL